MNWILVLYTVLLFVILTPAILVRLPPNGNKWTVAFVHGLVFALVFHFTEPFISNLSYGFEGFKEGGMFGNKPRGQPPGQAQAQAMADAAKKAAGSAPYRQNNYAGGRM